MAEIIDLDEALPPDKKVRLDGRVYILPGDIPVDLFLRIRQAEAKLRAEDNDVSWVDDMHDALLGLFQKRNKDVESLPLGMAQMLTLFPKVYAVPVEEEDGRPPRTRGGTSPSSGRRSRS